MDANKLKKLREVGYEVQGCCYLCEHSSFNDKITDWGVCTKNEYIHLKHIGPARFMSVTRYGRCKDFQTASGIAAGLAAYMEFYKPERCEECKDKEGKR